MNYRKGIIDDCNGKRKLVVFVKNQAKYYATPTTIEHYKELKRKDDCLIKAYIKYNGEKYVLYYDELQVYCYEEFEIYLTKLTNR